MRAQLSVASGVTTSRLEFGLRALAWGLLSFVGFIAVFAALVWPIGQLEQAVGLPHSVYLALWALLWVPGSGFLALLAARLVLGTRPDVRTLAWVLLGLGALVSAVQIEVLSEWAIRRYGANDSDVIGPTIWFFGVVAGVAVAGFAVQIAPRSAAWAPFVGVFGGVAIGASMMVQNVPGLADGLPTDSLLLAGTMFVAVLYIGAVAILSLDRLRRG